VTLKKKFPSRSVAIQEYQAKTEELREKLADNPEELRIINEVETFVQDLLTGSGSFDCELDYDSDDSAYSSDTNSETDDDNRDPTFSKYTSEQWKKIIDAYFNKRWKFKTVKQQYRKLISATEIHRARD
jgi:hypothetical protein